MVCQEKCEKTLNVSKMTQVLESKAELDGAFFLYSNKNNNIGNYRDLKVSDIDCAPFRHF